MREFDGKVVLITGGTRGIGAACVRAFLAAGATVAWSGSSPASVQNAQANLPAQADAGFVADLAQPDAPTKLIEAVLARHGRLDSLINNAGVLDASPELDAATVDDWDRVLAVNLRAAFFAARAAAEAMRAAGGGSIVMLGSIAAQIGGVATGPAYVASKAGVEGLTRSLARRLAPFNIRVNCVAPSAIDTDMVAAWSQEARQRVMAMTPLGRFGQPDDVVQAVLYLASERASYVTGQTINVNGGAYMG